MVLRQLTGLAFAAWLVSLAPAAAATPQNVSMRTEDGLTLLGTLYLPPRPGPGIILLHMQTRSREDWQAAASRLADAGFAALAIDFRGHGGSDPVPADSKDLSRLTLDVKAAKGFLAMRPEVVSGRIGLAGASIGANVAVAYAAGDATVRSLALLSAGLDYRGLRTEASMAKLRKTAILFVASEEDSYAANSARRLGKHEGQRELRLLSGAGHGTVMLNRQPELAAALVDWFRRTLL